MSKPQKFCAALLLISTLSLPAFGGQIEIGVAPPKPEPTPAQASGEITTGVTDDAQTGDAEEVAAEVVLAEAVLGLVQGALSLL